MEDEEEEIVLPTTDEFGGYSSRLRLHEMFNENNSSGLNFQEMSAKNNFGGADQSLESNLCELLGIDVEAMALAIVMED